MKKKKSFYSEYFDVDWVINNFETGGREALLKKIGDRGFYYYKQRWEPPISLWINKDGILTIKVGMKNYDD